MRVRNLSVFTTVRPLIFTFQPCSRSLYLVFWLSLFSDDCHFPTVTSFTQIHLRSSGGWGNYLKPNVLSFAFMGLYGPCYYFWVLGRVSNLDGLIRGDLSQEYLISWVHRMLIDYALDYCKHPFYLSSSSLLKTCIHSEREITILLMAHLHLLNLCSLSYLSSPVLEEGPYPIGETMFCDTYKLWLSLLCSLSYLSSQVLEECPYPIGETMFYKLWSSPLTTLGFPLEDVHMSIQWLMILPSTSVGNTPLLWCNWCLQTQPFNLICYCRPLSQARNLHEATGCTYKSTISRVSKSTAFTGTRSFFPPSLPDTTKYPIFRAADLSSTMSCYTSCRFFLAAPKRVIDLNSRLHPYLGFFVCFYKHLSHWKLYGVLCDIHTLPPLLEALSSIFIVIFPVFRSVVCIRLSVFIIVLKLYVIFELK